MKPLQTKFKEFTQIEKEVNDNERTIVHYISTSDKDRTNEVINPAVISDINFKKNPVVLFSHNYDWVIGKSLWSKIDSSGYGYLSKTQFAKTPLAEEVFNLYKDGFLNSWSIGYRELEPGNFQDDGTYVYSSIELLEYSSVSVPANPGAINLNFVKGLKSDELKNHYMADFIIKEMEESIKSLQNEIEQLKQSDLKNLLETYKAETEKRISEIAGDLEIINSYFLKEFINKSVTGAIRNAIKA